MEEKQIGKITHYFPKAGAGTIEITDGELNAGDDIRVKGHTTDFTQKVESMQIEQTKIQSAKKGDVVGVKVNQPVRNGDLVYKITA